MLGRVLSDTAAVRAPEYGHANRWRVREISDWRAFLGQRRAWLALEGADRDGALLGHDWMAQCWKCCGELRRGERPLVLAMGEQAFVALRHNLKTRRICFLEERRSQRLDLLGDQRGWEALGEYFRRRRDWDRLDLHFLRMASVEYILTTWRKLGLHAFLRGRIAQRRIRLDRSWEDVEAEFSPYLKANFRRRWKRLRARGEVRLTVHNQVEELAPVLSECFRLERSGWKAGTAIADDRELHRFYRQLAYRMAARGRLRLFCLRVAERIVAFEYCIASGRKLYALKIGYDEQLRTASPGAVLRWMLLQAAQPEYDWYEFLGDDAPWKAEWTPATEALRHVRIYNRTLRGQFWRARDQVPPLVNGILSAWGSKRRF
ncbi:MAG TPA: GNAT family N-acetyltransferase [Terriglobales bacterium]|nr:GNAT family N-acetyltransferase [Terriglobales bacterium]